MKSQLIELQKLGFFVWLSEMVNENLNSTENDIRDGNELDEIEKTSTRALAFRFMREKYKLFGYIKHISTGFSVYVDDFDFAGHHVFSEYLILPIYEEAESKCLDKLIEIVKLKKEV